MKIEVKQEPKQVEVKYPCLMKNKNNNSIVLFTNQFTGTYIEAENDEEIGYYSSGFNINNFELFKGSITISND